MKLDLHAGANLDVNKFRLRFPEIQQNAENIGSEKLKVDNRIGVTYIPVVDICLLSFGYRALGTAP